MENKDCISLWISKAHLKLKNSLAQKLRKYNLTVEQRLILMYLYENESMTQREICKETLSEASNVTVTLKRMEQNGFIVKSKHPNDKRTTLISVTQKARDIEEEMQELGDDNLDTLLKDVDDKEKEIAVKVMKQIYQKALKEEFDSLL